MIELFRKRRKEYTLLVIKKELDFLLKIVVFATKRGELVLQTK